MMKDINQFACSRKKRSLRSYESPLNCLRKRKKKKTTFSVTPEKLDKQTTVDSLSQQSSSRNSVIVITDSDTETSSRSEEDALSDSAEYNSKQSFLQLKSEKKQRAFKKKTSRPSIIILENESCLIDSSSMKESSSNGENVAPSQVEDDVVELWSSLKSPQRKKCTRKLIRRYFCKSNTNRAKFVIDKKPDYTNLEFPANKSSSIRIRRQKKYNSETLMRNINKTISYRDESLMRRTRLRARNINIRETKKAKCKKFNNPAHDVSAREMKKTECDKNHNNSTNSNRKLREIVVDGCNTALLYTKGQGFSEKGIKIVIDYFESRGHVVKVFLPQHIRKRRYLLLEELYKKGIVVFTPSRTIAGKQITSYDDRYILEYATKCEGIVISSDQFRDLYEEKPEWRDTILNRLLAPTFVGDYIMFPEDPLGKSGPNLETFLRH